MRPLRKRPLGLAALCVLGLLLAERTGAQVCPAGTPAAPHGLLASFIDTALNVPKGEDTEFFTRSSGVPNIFFLFDTSPSMLRLPPNGPSSFPGTLPPLQDMTVTGSLLPGWNADCPAGTDCAVMGCGDDPVSAPFAGGGTVIGFLRSRTYAPPCGTAVDTKWVGGRYQEDPTTGATATVDYAYQSRVCPYWDSSGPAANKDGFDPDFYCGSNGNTTGCPGNRPNLFDAQAVFHDTLAAGAGPTGWPGDGWTGAAVNPAARNATFTDFCRTTYGNTAQQGGQLKRDICTQCLQNRGFVLDGRLFRQNLDGGTADPATPVPSIYYSGNFLNFYPPKFVVTRKVAKDVIMTLSKVRAAMAHFGATGLDGRSNQYQTFNPACDHPESSSFDSNRSTYINAINGWGFTSGKPLTRSLLDVGYYYHSTDLPWWSDSYAGPMAGLANATQAAICYACQNSSVIVLTDGVPWASERAVLPAGTTTAAQVNALYAGDPATGVVPGTSGATPIDSALCPKCNDFTGSDDWKNDPARLAWYLNHLDLRRNGETTLDCEGNGGRQTINVYGVGFATEGMADANRVLTNMSNAGGGFFVSAADPSTLKQGILSVLDDINTRSTSFSVATVSTLQTTAGHSVIIPRFDPVKGAHWKGHLFRHELYSEFLNPCTETPDGSGPGDLDCDGRCQSVFLMDRDGDFIQEDADGVLRKNDPLDQVPCSSAPRCAALGKACGVPGTAAANPWWDAQTPLSSNTWSSRKVYTVVDRDEDGNSDGRVDANDVVFQLDTSDATADKVAPYMALGSGATCNGIASRILAAGDALTAARVQASQRFCVKTIIRYVLGADVFNEKGADVSGWVRAPTDAGQDTLPDRAFKLGDIFHSSPVVVDPPPPATGVLCPNGLHNQCLTSLWQTPVPSDPPGTNAYDAYAKSATYGNRRKVVVVGANDGMLHAFNGGEWKAGQRDDFIWEKTGHQVDTAKPPYNGYYDRGGGEELWAFVPPDMLAKLPLFAGPAHQLFVDGSPMVRDVWVDGSYNGMPGAPGAPGDPGTKDGKKQPWEFHTVGLFAERRGGTHVFALDLTDATKLPSETGYAPPRFLWIYPQPGPGSGPDTSPTLGFGETYNDYLPVGPPIGPVRLATTAAGAPTVDVPDPASTSGGTRTVAYEERWVAMLSGGFDPQYLRGRGVYMVDVWTGQTLWDFAYPDRSSSAVGDPRLQLKGPVPSTVAMVMWGKGERRQRAFENDGYFDTATFGDAAGQLWVLRFGAPGEAGSDGRMTNWHGARVMEMPGCSNQPFFYMTANVPVSGGIYRVLAGTGDRFNLLDTNGGICGPDNLRACIQRGCQVTVDAANNFLSTPELGIRSQDLRNAGTSSCAVSTSSDVGAASACSAAGRARVTISNCPSPSPSSGARGTVKDYRMTCTQGTTGLSCAYDATPTPGAQVSLSNTTNAITQPNWFFSLRVFDDAGARKIFWTQSQANAYDSARLTVSSPTSMSSGIVAIDSAVDVPTTLADAASAGWAMYYNHGGNVTVGDHVYPVSALDERTSSTSAVYGGVFWNATQPVLGASTRANTSGRCPNVALCTMESRRLSYHYGADVTTGGPVMRDLQGNYVRAFKSTTLVPTMGDQPTVFVNQKGQVQVGLTAVNPEKGASNIDQGGVLDPAPAYGLIEVSRGMHACRHSGAAPASCGQ